MHSLRERNGLPVADNETFEPPAENDTAGHNEQPRHDVPAVIEEQPHPDGSDVNATIIIDGDEEDFMDIDEGNIGEGIIGTDTKVESDEEPTDEAPNVNLTEDSDTHLDTAPAPAPAPIFPMPQPVHAVARAESHDSARAHTLSMSNETEDTAQNQPNDRTLSAVAGMLSLRECDGLPVADNETFEPPAENNTAGHNEQPRHDVPAVIEEQPHPDGSDVNALIIRDGDEEDFMDIDDGNIGEGIIGTDTEVESDEEPNGEAPNVNLTEDSDTHRDSDQGTNQHAAQGWREKCMEKYEEFSRINSNRRRETSNLLDFPAICHAFERIMDEFLAPDKLAEKISEKLYQKEFSLGCPSRHAKSRKGRQDILDAIKEVVESYGHDDDSDGHDDDSDESDNDCCGLDASGGRPQQFTTRTDASIYLTTKLTDDFKPYEGHKEFTRTHPDLYICELPRRSQTQRCSNEKDCYWRLFDKKDKAYPFMHCDALGDNQEGVVTQVLRSYKAVDKYLGWAIPEYLPVRP